VLDKFSKQPLGSARLSPDRNIPLSVVLKNTATNH